MLMLSENWYLLAVTASQYDAAEVIQSCISNKYWVVPWKINGQNNRPSSLPSAAEGSGLASVWSTASSTFEPSFAMLSKSLGLSLASARSSASWVGLSILSFPISLFWGCRQAERRLSRC